VLLATPTIKPLLAVGLHLQVLFCVLLQVALVAEGSRSGVVLLLKFDCAGVGILQILGEQSRQLMSAGRLRLPSGGLPSRW
jgi:hypothetical protein